MKCSDEETDRDSGPGLCLLALLPQATRQPLITDIGSDGAVFSNPIVEQLAPAFSLERFIPTFAANGTTRSSGTAAQPAATYRCDGRTHCSQMRSCEETTFFLHNCPGTKMDGNNDDVPC